MNTYEDFAAYMDRYLRERGIDVPGFPPNHDSDAEVEHGPISPGGVTNLRLVDEYLHNAALEGDQFVQAALRQPDCPRRFVLPQYAPTFDVIRDIDQNSYRVRTYVALGGGDRPLLVNYVDFGDKRRPTDLIGKPIPTNGIRTVYQPQKWVLATTFDETTGDGIAWEFTDSYIPYSPEDVLALVAEWLETEAKRLGAPEPKVNFSPFDG